MDDLIEVVFTTKLKKADIEEMADFHKYPTEVDGPVPNPDYDQDNELEPKMVMGKIKNPDSKVEWIINKHLTPKILDVMVNELTASKIQTTAPSELLKLKEELKDTLRDEKTSSVKIN